jgi:hypothetical protein
MARDGLSHDLESPEEHGEGKRPGRGGKTVRQEGGFVDGEYGRGSTPYRKSHGAAAGTLNQHAGNSGRGGSGIIGGGDGFKGHKEDIEHPQSHSEFENLGRDGGGNVGGRD